ncbi:hypothetical protein CBI31_08920 [Polynucleobacter campilacus]|uniref:Uncharacterized protein n=1 Tax=Polynucleobacter campilacus TaxID=1743163 RepID=A0A254PU80_9BURK|nr:hypothetical protein CBI31_08920 [Polynucleobacter campilacus]
MTSPNGVGKFVAMRHFKHKFAVLQHLVVKIPTVITIRDNLGNKKSSNYLNLMDLFKKYIGGGNCK